MTINHVDRSAGYTTDLWFAEVLQGTDLHGMPEPKPARATALVRIPPLGRIGFAVVAARG